MIRDLFATLIVGGGFWMLRSVLFEREPGGHQAEPLTPTSNPLGAGPDAAAPSRSTHTESGAA